MDKFEVRRLNLRAVLNTHCGGKAATLASKIDRSASYISRMLYPEGKIGKKRIGEDMRDIIEQALGLEPLSLDNQASAATERGGLLSVANGKGSSPAPSAAPDKPQSDDAQPDLGPAQETTLERLGANEKRLLELYRRSTKDGKTMIYGAAVVAPKQGASGPVDQSG